MRLSWLAVAAAVLFTGATSPEGRLIIACATAPDCAIDGSLILHDIGGSVRNVPLVRSAAQLPPGDWDVELDAPGYWMPAQRLGNRSGAVTVWPTTTLRGRFLLQAKDAALPKSFVIAFESVPGTSGPAIARGASVPCPIAADGSWGCSVPAAALDLVLRAKTFTPHYLWNVKLPRGTAADLGTLPLRQGASVVAWLDSKTVKSLKAPVHARLVRMTMTGSPTLGERLSQPVAESAFNARGMVQLAPVPPGTYTLEVTAPGAAPARLDQIEVYAHSESVLRPAITLGPPLTIRVTVDPPRDPAGAAWRVSIFRIDPFTFRRSSVSEGSAPHGTFAAGDQPPGRYEVVVGDARSDVFARRELQIHDDGDARAAIEIPTIRLHGRLTAAHEPLAARLWFGGRNGAERAGADSGEDGAFDVALPHAGTWKVEIESPDAGVLTAVTTKIADTQERLNIDLPDTEIRGWVTGTDGRRVGGATVVLLMDDGALSRRTEGDGTFRFRGVRAGAVTLQASHPRTPEHSRHVKLDVADGVHTADVELVLQDVRPLKGMVMSQGQPLIGARVTGFGFEGGAARQQRAVTGLDGGFELSFPSGALEISLIVAAPGRTLHAFTTAPTDKPVTLDVAPVGGVLRLRFPAGTSRPRLYYNGALIPMSEVLEWANAQDPQSLQGETLSVAAAAPGYYRLCTARGASDICRDGILPRMGTLALSPE